MKNSLLLKLLRKCLESKKAQSSKVTLFLLLVVTGNVYATNGHETGRIRSEIQNQQERTDLQKQQQRSIVGVVNDATGLPLVGVAIRVEGTNTGTITDLDGKFTLQNLTSDATILISYIGYDSQKIAIGNKTSLDVVLVEDVELLDEVIVVGYGTSKKRDIIGSISTVDGKTITQVPSASFQNALQGTVSGVLVSSNSSHPGSGPKIQVRGQNSINLSTEPLWIIDGVPVQTGALEQTVGGVKGVSPLSMINPNDIESIQVLKDAAATAIYGNRGSSGVIIVTTKSNSTGLNNIAINCDAGVSQIPFNQHEHYVDSRTWWNLYDKAWANVGNKSVLEPQTIIDANFMGEKPRMTRDEALTTDTDHLGALSRSAWFHQIGLTANKGIKDGGLLFSLNYRDEKGLLNNNDFKRLSMRLNFNYELIKNLKLGVNTSFLYLRTNGVKSGINKGEGGWTSWSMMHPWYKIYDQENQKGYWGINSGYNAKSFSDRDLIRNAVDQYRSISNAYLQWITPLEGLMVKGEVGVDLMVNNSTHWQSEFLSPSRPYTDVAREKSITKSIVNYDVYANYNKTFGKHSIDATLGAEASRDWLYSRAAAGQNLQSIYPELNNPLVMLSMSGGRGGERYLMGFFARANYKLLDRYIINASIRRDGHYALSKDNRWANFAAGGVGWIISDEPFMSSIEEINLLKLRASYGSTGNSNISNNMTYMSWNLDKENIFGVNYLPAATTVGPLGSADLRWETTKNFDVGVDFGVLNNRINGSVAYYNQRTSDLILRGNVAPSVGYASNQIYENIGDMDNWGFEFNVSSTNIENKNFRWTTDFNISTNKNKIVRLNEFEKGKGNEGNEFIRKEGESLGTWYLAQYEHVDPERGINMIHKRDKDIWDNEFRTESTGELIPMTVNNMNSNKMIQHGKTELPTFFGGLTNNFYYKDFDLNVMLSFAGGHYIMNRVYERGTQFEGVFNLAKDAVGNYWEKPGDIAEFPQPMWGNGHYYNNNGEHTPGRLTKYSTSFTTRYLEKGDYLRLRNLQLGYSLPNSVTSRIGIKKTRFYVGVTNLFTITGYEGYDPETQMDLPAARVFNFGVSVNL